MKYDEEDDVENGLKSDTTRDFDEWFEKRILELTEKEQNEKELREFEEKPDEE